MKDYKEVVKSWLEGNFDAETKAAVKRLQETDPVGLEDAFYRNLEFGTGGLRGIMGVGTNRMNKYTVGMATQGLANYIKEHVPGAASVCIAHDSRNNSRLFAEISADVLSNNGIHVFLFEDLRPTPELSYSIRVKGATAGIMVTASHNPKEYNGYKVFFLERRRPDHRARGQGHRRRSRQDRGPRRRPFRPRPRHHPRRHRNDGSRNR